MDLNTIYENTVSHTPLSTRNMSLFSVALHDILVSALRLFKPLNPLLPSIQLTATATVRVGVRISVGIHSGYRTVSMVP